VPHKNIYFSKQGKTHVACTYYLVTSLKPS